MLCECDKLTRHEIRIMPNTTTRQVIPVNIGARNSIRCSYVTQTLVTTLSSHGK
jgi:hypothetical protein